MESVAASSRAVLVSTSGDGSHVLVVPQDVAAAEARTFAVLAGARTFGDLTEDDDAKALVDDWSSSYVERFEESGLEVPLGVDLDARTVSPGTPFDADDFFGLDNWRVWRPDPRNSTATWLADTEPELYESFCVQDGDWGLMELQDDPVVPAGSYASLVAKLHERGYQVRTDVDIEVLYA